MNTTGKWLARAGALFLLIGFFLPSVAVSCTGLGVKQSFSLSDLSGQSGQGAVWLVLIMAIALAALTLIPVRSKSNTIYLIIGQLASLGISALVLLICLGSIYNQVQKASNMGGLFGDVSLFSYSLEFGAFILVIGYLLGGVGAIIQFGETGSNPTSQTRVPMFARPATPMPPPVPPSVPLPPVAPPPMRSGATLEVVAGPAPHSVTAIVDNFIVGRGHDSHLQLADSTVSRQHLRLRCASGAWFLQDMGSAGGTQVNGQRVQATRLSNGDKIQLGGTTLIFRS